ncbi:MAG: helix-turn-helix domain-containing protein [Ruminococcaceae bacterium]|nr:helix-turn-helix domain-containing protein [Oscillospiraceae bacterium]
MDYITAKEAAEKWGVTPRRVQILCNEGKIKGAYRFGRSWMIPSRAVLPSSAKGKVPHMPMPRKSPFLDMTDLYNSAGQAEECIEMLVNNPEAHALIEAQIAYRRGEIDHVYDKARYFLSSHSGFYAILGGGMLLALCAIWRGDANLWNEAKKHICEAPCESQHEREIISLTLAIIDSSIYDNKDYPEWFTVGNFETLPADSHPAAKVFYIKYLYMEAFAIASKQIQVEGVSGLALMRMIPNTIEPLITQAVVDKTVIPEIYLRMSCAVAYHNTGQREKAIAHMDKAIALALKDRLYGLLTEYVRHFDGLLEERISLISESAAEAVSELHTIYRLGWSRLSGKIKNVYVATNLTQKEHEVAKLSAFGFSVKEIAAMLYVSESTIKQTIARVIHKAGLQDKSEFSYII